jgi:hypothetical protein
VHAAVTAAEAAGCAAEGWCAIDRCAVAAVLPAHSRVGMLTQLLLLLLHTLKSPAKSLIMQLLTLDAALLHSSCMHCNERGWVFCCWVG